MVTLQTYYESKFKNKIKLTRESDEYKKARKKDELLRPKVKKSLTDNGFDVESDFIQGSMSTNTAIKPLDGDYDIDRAIVIRHKNTDDSDPRPPKIVIEKALKAHGFQQPKIKKPCVTADYASDNIHIDYPVYRSEGAAEGVEKDEDYELAVGKKHSSEDNRYWDSSRPKKLIDWICNSVYHANSFFVIRYLTDSEKDQFRRLVRYIKRWRDVNFTNDNDRKKVYSIALTVMIKESFKPSIDDDGKKDDHAALRKTIRYILNSQSYFIPVEQNAYEISVPLPEDPNGRDIYHESSKVIGTKLRKKFQTLLEALEEVDELDDLHEQTKILNKHFGADFKIHPKEDKSESNANKSRLTLSHTPRGA